MQGSVQGDELRLPAEHRSHADFLRRLESQPRVEALFAGGAEQEHAVPRAGLGEGHQPAHHLRADAQPLQVRMHDHILVADEEPAVADGAIYVGDLAGVLHAVNAAAFELGRKVAAAQGTIS